MPDAPRFLLVRYNWRRDGNNLVRLPGSNVVAAFETADAADAVCRNREMEARGFVGNPFRLSPPHTSMPDPVFRDWLADHDLTPPADGDWVYWWDATAPYWTDRQSAAVWQALDRFRFFAVTERPVLYAVVETGWEYNDSGYTADAEGGTVMRLYRSREKAEAERDRLHALRVKRDEGVEWACYQCAGRLNADPFRPHSDETDRHPADAPFYEVIEVPAEDDP